MKLCSIFFCCGWNFPPAVLQAGRDESDTVDEAQAAVDAKARVVTHVHVTRVGTSRQFLCVCVCVTSGDL